MDAIILTLIGSVSTATVALTNAPVSQLNSAELQLFLLPFIGALILSGGMIMLNPQPETRKIILGRSFVSLFFGVLAPQIIGMLHPNLAALSVKPVFLVLSGGVFSAVAYILAASLTRELYAKADGVAKRTADMIENKAFPQTITKTQITQTTEEVK